MIRKIIVIFIVRNGRMVLVMVFICFWEIDVVINNMSFIGGVVRLMVRLMFMMIVKWIGLIFIFRKIGLRIGLRMMMVGFVFRNMLIINKRRLIRNNRINGFFDRFNMNFVMICGV